MNEVFSSFVQSLRDGDNQFTLLNDYLMDDDSEEDLKRKDYNGIAQLIKSALTIKNPVWLHYLLNIDLLRGLKSYYTFDDDQDQEIIPDSIDILSYNFNLAKDHLTGLKDLNNVKEVVEEQFKFLLEVPLKYSLKNLKSMVKDVGKTLGKKVKLQLTGDQGSLDKDNLSLLKDAIIHIVRNALDHGIEAPSERASIGKSEIGEIIVSCKESRSPGFMTNNSSGTLEVLIKDDGRGIDYNRICDKALKMGLFEESDLVSMSEEEKTSIIFNPGFSTKDTVSEISGRGIGMDVVRTNLQKIGADISIKNFKGLGLSSIFLSKSDFNLNSDSSGFFNKYSASLKCVDSLSSERTLSSEKPS